MGFLTLLKDADPDMPILKQAKAEYRSCNKWLAQKKRLTPVPGSRRYNSCMSGRECYHCKKWIEDGEEHDCWTTTEAALTQELSDDLRDAWERRRETAELSLRTFWTLLRELSSRRRRLPRNVRKQDLFEASGLIARASEGRNTTLHN